MKRFKLLNNIVGWVVFAIAATTYLLTIEPTASFWDCGEFISTADKLEVGHPPGAPFFMLTAKFFTLFASDQTQVAMMVNSFSAICSALCILFLFWTITHLTRKLVLDGDISEQTEIPMNKIITILGAGAVGALAYTFSDTFWFSAVEGEVYAYSSLFTAVVFWAILKWEDVANQPYANRWLILIAYLMGLSIGVHLLNLLTIPVLALVYYYKKFTPTTKGTIYTLLASCGILAVILYGIVPGFVQVAGWFELFFVNQLGWSFNSGTIIYACALIICLIWGLKVSGENACDISEKSDSDSEDEGGKGNLTVYIAFTLAILLLGIPFFGGRLPIWLGLILTIGIFMFLYMKRYQNMAMLNTILLACTVIIIGYSTYATIIIRSAANTPMDQNSPDDVFALKSYLNREQYGDTPLLWGESYASEIKRKKTNLGWEADITTGAPIYAKKIKTSPEEPDSYEAYDEEKKYNYDNCMFFPRMYSKQASHIEEYKAWGNIEGKKVRYDYMGEKRTKIVPTFGENLTYFFRYQVGFMYFRYFMWNFVGRQNDIQSHGGILHGNWISGIDFIDDSRLGDQDKLPDELKNNKGRNTYYFLPLLLGILGIFFQFSKKEKGNQSFWITFILFFMTGLAIILYLNQTPLQPRERDYAYAGSFYAFCIWIGLGVPYIVELLEKIKPLKRIAATLATLLCLGVPALMAAENWDDHDRSGRFTARDFGQNYLLSLEPDAIIFTNGDNDTFPLWYNQEVEGVGTNARVANLSYLQMGWYVDQMKRQAYESSPLPLSMEAKDYMNGKMDIVYLSQGVPELDFSLAMDIAKNPKKYSRFNPYRDDEINFIPSKNFHLAVNKDDVVAAGIVTEGEKELVEDQIRINLNNRSYLGKNDLVIMDLLQNNNWKRPIYFAVTVGSDSYLGLNPYFSLEGMAYRVIPKVNGVFSRSEQVNIERTYDNLLHKFKWGGIAENPDIYLDENNLRMTNTLRFMFLRLTDALMSQNRKIEIEKNFCEVLRVVLTQNPLEKADPTIVNPFRYLCYNYYNNDRLGRDTKTYPDSLLLAKAPEVAAEILKVSAKTPKNELIEKLNKHIAQIDTTANNALIAENEKKAIEALDYCHKVLPSPQVPYTTANLMMARQYNELGEDEKAKNILAELEKNSKQYLEWFSGLSPKKLSVVRREFQEQFEIYSEILRLYEIMGIEAKPEDYNKFYSIYKVLNQ